MSCIASSLHRLYGIIAYSCRISKYNTFQNFICCSRFISASVYAVNCPKASEFKENMQKSRVAVLKLNHSCVKFIIFTNRTFLRYVSQRFIVINHNNPLYINVF